MSVDKIRTLLELMKQNDLVELEMEEGDFKIRMKKPGAEITMVQAPAAQVAAPAAPAAAPASATAAPAPANDPNLIPIKSPIVGTFYRCPSPEADPFVSEGSKVGKDTVVGIIEAMKIMNEIKAEVTGTIEKILIENGEPIEYGQPLFLVRP